MVNNQHRVLARHQYEDPSTEQQQQRYEDEAIGFPLLITLPREIKITMIQIREGLWKLIQPFIKNQDLTLTDELPFELWAAWGFSQHEKLVHTDEEFDVNKRN